MDDARLLRYDRHILLPEIDIDGQQRLLDASVCIIGLGGLGSAAALYLGAAGIGNIQLVDDDKVDISNLQRQVIHNENSTGMNKAASAAKTLQALNHETELNVIPQRLDDAAMQSLFADSDLVLDATDNFLSRQQINRACVATNTPLVSGAAIRFEAQVTVFDHRQEDSACYACLYGETPDEAEENCTSNGVLSPVVGIAGTTMAAEAMKLLAGAGEGLQGRLLLLDALSMQWREMRYRRDPGCPVCGGSHA